MQRADSNGFEIDNRRRRGMAKGLALFCAVLFLVLISSGAYADQVCLDCHDTNQHSQCDANNCAACHANPPVDAGGLIHPYAGEPNPVPSGSGSAGAHAKHATPSGYNYPCSACHYGGMNVSSGQMTGGTNNGNGILQMGFSIPMPGGAALSGGTYNGVPGSAYPYEGTNGTTVTTGGTKTCSSIYCHSDGTYVSAGSIPAGSAAPSWDTTSVPLSCGACHGYPPSYESGAPKANSHQLPSHYECKLCHFGVTEDGITIANAGNHANGVFNLQPDTSATFKGVPVSFNYSYDPGGGTCSNISCHNGTSWTWGVAFTSDNCTVCHTEIIQSGTGQNHHSGTCTACHSDTYAGIGLKPHDGIPPATTTSCEGCHALQASENSHPKGANSPFDSALYPDGPCLKCHSAGGAIPAVSVICGQCHDGSVPGLPVLTPAELASYARDIHSSKPIANFSSADDDTVSFKVHFTASGCPAGNTCTYDWTWGDGTSSNGVTSVNASKTYADATTRTVVLVINDTTTSASSNPVSKQITPVSRNTPPTAIKLTPVVTGMTATVSDRSTDAEDAPGAMTVTVLCGNSTVATGPDNSDLVCTYTTTGTYIVRHSVRDTGGLVSSSENATVTIATPARTTVSGTLTKQDGTPISGAVLYLQVGTQNKYVAASAAGTGNFTFTNVLPGTYTIKAVKSGYTFTLPAESVPASIVVNSVPVTGVVVKSVQ